MLPKQKYHRLLKVNQKTRFTNFIQVKARHSLTSPHMYNAGNPGAPCSSRTKCLSLCWQRLCHVHGRGLHWPPLLVGLQQAVQLLQVSHDVVLDVRRRDLESHTATVKGTREVTREHFVYHPGHDWNDLLKK